MWSKATKIIPGRTGKQIRERWCNNLDPALRRGDWTFQEDVKIFDLFEEYGTQWSLIASKFDGRTENALKNRFYTSLRRIAATKLKEDYASKKIKKFPSI